MKYLNNKLAPTNRRGKADPYYKQTLVFNFHKQHLQFRVSQSLFGSHALDEGTKLLLRYLPDLINSHQVTKVLDVGCGYGAIGLTIKALFSQTEVHLTDRDALAVEYSKQNAVLNGLEVSAYGSLGLSDILAADFDLVVSNLPGKAGESVIKDWLKNLGNYLLPGGLFAVVVVKPLANFTKDCLDNLPATKLLFERATPNYTVFYYRFQNGNQGTRIKSNGLMTYHRSTKTFSHRTLRYRLETAYGLPEFDTLGFETGLLLDQLMAKFRHPVNHTVVVNPSQGHVPIALTQTANPTKITLVSRDLLSLRYSALNLRRHHYAAISLASVHQPTIYEIKDLGAWALSLIRLRDDENPLVADLTLKNLALRASPEANVLMAGSTTAIVRIKQSRSLKTTWRIIDLRKYKGYSLLQLQKI